MTNTEDDRRREFARRNGREGEARQRECITYVKRELVATSS